MASEKQVNILMQLLDEALAEVDTIEGKLSSYEEMLQSVKEQMDQISQSNHLIQLSNTNNMRLLEEIDFLVVRCRMWMDEDSGCLHDISHGTFIPRTTWTCPRVTYVRFRMETCLRPRGLKPVSMLQKLCCSA